ncbi:MAG TPA: DUF2231 domain-containing protein [bacterium]|nr:DUF2231 domain-containing protein [bacterium]
MSLLVHPLIVHFPIALWMTAAFFDLLYLARRQEIFASMARWMIGLGLAGAAVSIIAGWRDLRLQEFLGVGTALRQAHMAHQLLAYASTGLFAAAFVGRWRRRPLTPGWTIVLSLVGAALVAVTGYVGGELRKVM